MRSKLLALAFVASCAPAHADTPEPCADVKALPGAVTVPLGRGPGADTVTVAPHDLHVAAVCYHNHIARRSMTGEWTVEAASIAVHVTVESTETWNERMTVTPPEGLHVLPSDVQDVQDGAGVTFWIVEAMG